VSLSNSLQFWEYWWFMQIRQIIFNCTDMEIMHFTLDKILKLLSYYTPFCHHSLQSDIKNSPVFFWPTLYGETGTRMTRISSVRRVVCCPAALCVFITFFSAVGLTLVSTAYNTVGVYFCCCSCAGCFSSNFGPQCERSISSLWGHSSTAGLRTQHQHRSVTRQLAHKPWTSV